MRKIVIVLFGWLMCCGAHGATPEVGKEKLRKLVKLPTITFDASWDFDPERGFLPGSVRRDATNEISRLRKELRRDISDAERYESLGKLYESTNLGTNARNAWTHAVDLYRKRVELQPDDGILLASLGESLRGVGRTQEAESVLRKASRVAPKEWRCRVALGRFLDSETRKAIYDGAMTEGGDGTDPSQADTERLKPAEVALARKRMEEAGECFEQAVADAPKESQPLFRRGMHRCFQRMMLNHIRLAAGEQDENLDLMSDCFSPASLADLQAACRLSPKNYRMLGGTVLFEIYAVASRKGQVDWHEFTWDSLPDKSQRSIHEAMAELEGLGQSGDTHVAAGALETLGILQGSVLREPRGCITSFRRALALDPAREQLWELLASNLAQAGRYDELLALSEERVKHNDSGRSRMLLAKAFEKLKRWEEAEEQVLAIVKETPSDFTANLALAALILKRSQDESALSDANDWLDRSQSILNKLPTAQRTRQQIVDFTLTRSIYFALADDVETARVWAKSVLSQDKENQLAQDILSAMDY